MRKNKTKNKIRRVCIATAEVVGAGRGVVVSRLIHLTLSLLSSSKVRYVLNCYQII